MEWRRLGERSLVCRVVCSVVVCGVMAAGSVGAHAAQRTVLGEQFTATWCVHCPEVRHAYSDLLDAYPDRFAGIQIHGADGFETSWGNARMGFYSVSGYPTTVQDGILTRVGNVGYSQYFSDFTSRVNIPTDVTLRVSGEHLSGATFRFSATVGLQTGGTAKTVRVYMVQVLDDYPAPGISGNYRNCLMQAASTADVYLTPGSSETVQRDFTFSGASWYSYHYQNQIKIVAWAQQIGGADEVYQAETVDWPFTTDCNGNGVRDDVDISSGDSFDCNTNGIPDDCEIETCPGDPYCGDGDGNGLLDSCDGYDLSDCNQNGLSDEAEIVAGLVDDCNQNTVPDGCDLAWTGPVSLVNTEAAVLGWRELYNTGGTPLYLGDEEVRQVTMPFSNAVFPEPVANIGNNGGVALGMAAGALGYTNYPLPSNYAFGGAQALLPWWDDLYSNSGNVYYKVEGSAPERVFIVEWYNRSHYNFSSGRITFQVQIFETPVDGIFAQYLYQDTVFGSSSYDNGRSATVGYQQNGSNADQYSYNQSVITPSLVLSLVGTPPVSEDDDENGIPDECAPSGCPGDSNCDGQINWRDIDFFVSAQNDNESAWYALHASVYGQPPSCPFDNNDVNADGTANWRDIDPFVAVQNTSCE